MNCSMPRLIVCAVALLALSTPSRAEILALLNYETKSAESLKALKAPMDPGARREGIAVMDLDPGSPNFGKVVEDIKLPPDLIAHHIFFNRAMTKAYVTALGQRVLTVIDLEKRPFVPVTVETPTCQVQEDIVFSNDNKFWYLTCMGSQNVIIGDAQTDKPLHSIALPVPYPHGVAIHEGINRMLTTNTVRPADLGDPGDSVGIVELSTGHQLGSVKVSNKPSPAGVASVEVLFVPRSDPPAAYVTTMFPGALWLLRWNAGRQNFDATEAFDFSQIGGGVALEMYFNDKADQLYVTTAAKPGGLHIFDISGGLEKPKLVKSIPAAEGAHHVAITADNRYAYVQNALLNLPGLSDGSVTVVDWQTRQRIGSIDTLKNQGLNPNCLVLLPKWYQPMGH